MPTLRGFAIGLSINILAAGFISPTFAVAGLLLAAIPIIIHLLNRRRYKVLDWAAMQFLLAAMRKNRRRLRFEQWLLLATRCALLFLLGLALARPLGCDSSSLAGMIGGSSALHVIVIDNSYSMAYESDRPSAKTNLDQAKKLAHAMVDKFSSGGDAVVLITAAKPAEAVIAKPTYDLAAANAAIDRIGQKYTATDLAGAFDLAERTGREEANQPTKTLDIFSDSTASAWHGGNEQTFEALGPKLAALYHVRHFNLSTPGATNAAVLDVSPSTNLVRTQFANSFNAIACSFGGTTETPLLWTLGDESLPGASAVQLDAQEKKFTQSNANIRTGGPTVIAAKLGSDDRLPVDNVRYRTLDVAAEMKVLIVEGRRGGEGLEGSGAFLNLALSPPPLPGSGAGSNSKGDSYIKAERISDIELGGRALGDYRAILLSDVAQIASPVADQLQKYVKAGGTIAWFMGEQVQRDNYNTILVPRGLLPGPLAQRQTGPGFTFAFSPTGNVHPLLAAFKDIQKSGLETAQVFTYWQTTLKPENKVEHILDFVGNDPAITLQPLGDGRIVFFATSADAEWTNFPAKPAYVALLHEILAGTVAGSERWMNLDVGQSLVVPQSVQFASPPSLRDPQSQAETPLVQTTRRDGSLVYTSQPLDHPGVWRLVSGTSSTPISVNVPSNEADIRPVSDEAIRQLLGNAPIETYGADLPAETATSTEANDFGWSIMTIVLALLGVECFLAMRFGHFKK